LSCAITEGATLGNMVGPAVYLALALLLLAFSFAVFRLVVRRDYRDLGRLRSRASLLQLLVFGAYFAFPYLFNPPEWPWFWMLNGSSSLAWQIAGLALICIGFLIAVATMAWFGIRRALGVHLVGLITRGPYKISRNPQILGGYLLVLGTALQRPSVYSVGWALMFAVIGHWMVVVEEEHLAATYGQQYQAYCRDVPRYLFNLGRRSRSPT
jgi:protein-S-isoprenylcysteine O-methyltransferase Ste14